MKGPNSLAGLGRGQKGRNLRILPEQLKAKGTYLYAMRYLHLLVAAIFILFAGWQFNDPDWLLWMITYLIVAIVAVWQFFGGAPPKYISFGMGFIFALLITRVPDLIDWFQQGTPSIVEEMKAEEPHIELTREVLGLAISLGTLAAYYYGAKLRKQPEE